MSVLLWTACRSTQTAVENTANLFSLSTQRDSIYLHDSVALSYRPAKIALPLREGIGIDPPPDTLYIERWHTRFRDREIIKTDTIIRTETQTETIEKPFVPPFYKYCTAFAILFMLLLLIQLARFIAKKISFNNHLFSINH